jgi:excisionase family DNA binding protein
LQDFLTVSQVAEELKVTKGTIRQYIQSGKLKASKPNGKNFIIMKTELLNFISDTEYKPLATL